ncbi:MAG TPA: DUF2254 family protein [Azospirillaceae bacterium]|nr:DUF2254 family protein [Azospirillaceae bacterium]
MDGRTGATAPHVAVTLASGLSLVSILTLLFFIHAVGRSIVTETMVGRLAAELDAHMGDLPPLAEGANGTGTADEGALLPEDFGARARTVPLALEGYVPSVDYPAIAEAARAAGVLVQFGLPAGAFLIHGAHHVRVYPEERASPELVQAITAAVMVGSLRTPVQDIEFSIRHLVEIAVRALSPAINDPFTAAAVIDRLGVAFSRLLGRSLGEGVHRDSGGVPRVFTVVPTHDEVLDIALRQIRHAARNTPAIIVQLLEMLAEVAAFARTDAARAALARQADIAAAAGCHGPIEPSDRALIEAAHAATREALARCGSAVDVPSPAV